MAAKAHDEPKTALTARALLDRAQDAADGESSDGLFTVTVEAWGGAVVTLRRLSFAQVGRAQLGAAGDAMKATRLLLYDSFVDPPFTKGEVDEIMDDPAQLSAAIALNSAVATINKTGLEAQVTGRAAFRSGNEV